MNTMYGFSGDHLFPQEGSDALEETRSGLMDRNILDERCIIYEYGSVRDREADLTQDLYLQLDEDAVLFELKGSNASGLEKAVNKGFEGPLKLQYMNMGMYLKMQSELESFLSYCQVQLNLPKKPGAYIDFDVYLYDDNLVDGVRKALLHRLVEMNADFMKMKQADENVAVGIREYIDMHYKNAVSLGLLSEKFHMSKEHISRKFKKEYGCSITDYLLELRMDRARELLSNTTMTIKDIAGPCGL